MAQPMRPTFDCGPGARPVEKAICSDPDLTRLDRQIAEAYRSALARQDRHGVARLRKDQRNFIAIRNRSFGNPHYQLRHDLESRLEALRAMGAGN